MKAIKNFTTQDWGIVVLVVLLGASLAGNIALGVLGGFVQVTAPGANRLVFGTMEGPADLDPQDAWDSASFDVIDNVVEGLFGYNLSDPNLPVIPMLAESLGSFGTNDSEGHVNYTVDLRTEYVVNLYTGDKEPITFHDGTTFGPEDVKFTFDRLYNLIDLGLAKAGELYEYWDIDAPQVYNLSTYDSTQIDELNNTYGVVVVNETTKFYKVFNGSSVPIINTTHIIDDDTVAFELNTKYGPFEALLCFGASYILPSDGQYPMDSVLDTAVDDLIGTGPFDYIGFEPGVEVTFIGYNNYWRGPPRIDQLVFSVINDPDARNQALLAGDVDILADPDTDLFSTFNSTENDISLVGPGPSTGVQYLGMNCKVINATIRKAISYALNYTYIIEELLDGYATRLKSPVPEGIKYANWSFDVAEYNLTKAREAMQEAGHGVGWDTTPGGANEDDWTSASFYTYNYTYNIGNDMREDMLSLLQDNMPKIGIKIVDSGTTWAEFIYTLYEIGGRKREDAPLYWLGWIPDYNDPSNFLNPLFTNRTIASNGVDLDDAQLQVWMEEALLMEDGPAREALYDQIQKRLVEDLYPWAYGYVGQNWDAYINTLKGFPQNAMGRAYFYPCYFSAATEE
ncbi:MAG: ABC transporter substrate-binding protein [Promethearchaeota archaeon]|nr:MAG: ABC transporter substrate-binding protein [Candidatus Lokiarchaeota archaeon]